MAVIVETGSIVANANSYASVGTADNYHETMGNTAWAALDDDTKDAALVRGTMMLESRFRGRWIGYQTNNNQGVVQRLAWPRKANDTQPTQDDPTVDADPQALTTIDKVIIGVNEIPQEVIYACMEAAYMQGVGNSLVPNVVQSDRYVKRNKVDVIEQEFFENRPAIDRFPLIDQLLQNLASVGGVNLTMVIGMTNDERNAIEGKDDATQNYLDSLNNG